MKKRLVILSIAVFALSSCFTNANKSKRILEEQGYVNIQMTGYDWWGCSKDDTFHDGFTAMTKDSTQVVGCVCSGWFKGSTIRLK